jgi:hypothetical protein
VFRRKIFGLKTELRKNLFHGNALAAVPLEPILSVMKAPPVFIGHWLVVRRRRSDGAGDRIRRLGWTRSAGRTT